jgi:hypothetical protein
MMSSSSLVSEFTIEPIQNSVDFEQVFGKSGTKSTFSLKFKTGQKPGFSDKSKEAVPQTEVLEQPHLSNKEGVRIGQNLA